MQQRKRARLRTYQTSPTSRETTAQVYRTPPAAHKSRRFAGDVLRILVALAIAVAVMAAGTWLTEQARPVVIAVAAYVFLTSLVLLIARREL